MEDIEKVTKGIEEAKQMIEKLGDALNKLESRREAALPSKTQWADIKAHLDNLEKSLHEKIKEVEKKEIVYDAKQSKACKLITKRETAVAARELASLNRLQELKDAAVSAIVVERKNYKEPPPMLVDAKGSKDKKKVSISPTDAPTAPTAPEENPPDNKSGNPAEVMAGELELCSQLKEACEKMDAKGLLKILSDNRKFLATISEKLSAALSSATEPALLVLDSLEGFYPPDASNPQEGGEDSTALKILRRTCLVMLEAVAPLLGVAEPANERPVSSEIKQQAKAIADEWKAKLAGVDIDASNGYSLEAIAFLQLLVTFNIAEEFHEDELCKLVLSVSRRRQATELCRSLGLVHRMPGVIQTLVKTGRQIDGVHFAYAFQLTKSFPPVPLLKEYLNNVKGSSQENSGATTAAGAQKDANNREMSALRVVIKCIEEYKLQEEYPIDPLKKRVAQLEKAKYEKKRMEQAAKAQPKKPRLSGGYAPRRPASLVNNWQLPPPVYDDRGAYSGFTERYTERYPYAAPPAYEAMSHAPRPPYHYADERVAPPVPYSSSTGYGTTTYANYAGSGYQSSAPSSYGNYTGTTGAQPASSNHGSYMGAGGQPSHQSYM